MSEKEFHGLASYMRQIPLTCLNLALNKINQALEKRRTGQWTLSLTFTIYYQEILVKIFYNVSNIFKNVFSPVDGEPNSEEFHMEDLTRILDVGLQAPVYILCLVDLKRMENMRGYGRNASFKILTKV